MEHWETQRNLYGTLDQWQEVLDIEYFTSYVYNGTSEQDLIDFISQHTEESEINRWAMQNDPF